MNVKTTTSSDSAVIFEETFPRKRGGLLHTAIKSQQESLDSQMKEFRILKSLMKMFDESKFPAKTDLWLSSYSVMIRIPWGTDNLRKARQAIGKGWEFSDKSDNSDGSICYRYFRYIYTGEKTGWGSEKRIYIPVTITMSTQQLPPDTCTRVLISEEEKTYKVQTWKVVCNDGTERLEEGEIVEEETNR